MITIMCIIKYLYVYNNIIVVCNMIVINVNNLWVELKT